MIERAGDIVEQRTSDPDGSHKRQSKSVPLITETTAGQLKCRKILFVNWSLAATPIDDDRLSESIQWFISKTIQHVVKHEQQSNSELRSISIAMPDVSQDDVIVAEETIEETINQIQSSKAFPLKISFVFSMHQKKLCKRFSTAIQAVQTNDHTSGVFCCPTSSRFSSKTNRRDVTGKSLHTLWSSDKL